MVATTLRAGQLALVHYNAEDGDDPLINGQQNTNRDTISFVLLAPIGSGTEIRLTDRSWTPTPGSTTLNAGSFSGSGTDGTATFTAATDLPAGTVITFTTAQLNAAGINFADAGEAIYIYQGTASAPTSFLFAAEVGDGNATFNASLGNTGLATAAHTAISVGADNGTFAGRTWNIQNSQLLENVNNQNYWATNENSPQEEHVHLGNIFTAPDQQTWIAASGGGNALIVVNKDATVGGGNTAYAIAHILQNTSSDGDGAGTTQRFYHPTDIVLDPLNNRFFVADSDGSQDRILQGTISDVLNNPGVAPTMTVLYREPIAQDGTGMTGIEIDPANQDVYFTRDNVLQRVDYNIPQQTPVTLATMPVDPEAGDPKSYANEIALDLTRGTIYVISTASSTDFTGNGLEIATVMQRNTIFQISNIAPGDTNSSGNTIAKLTWPAAFQETFNPALGGGQAPDELNDSLGKLTGIDVNEATGEIWFTTVQLNNGGNGYTGGIFKATSNGTSLTVTTIYTESSSNANFQFIDVDEASGRYYVTSLENTGNNTHKVYHGSLTGGGTLDDPIAFGDTANYNGLAGLGLHAHNAPTLTGAGNAGLAVTEASGAPNSGSTAAVTLYGTLAAGDIDTAGGDELTGAQVRISGNFVREAASTATGHTASQDYLLINGSQSGTIAGSGIQYSYNAVHGVMTLTGAATVAEYAAALQTVQFLTSGDNVTGDGDAPTRTISASVFDGLLYSDEVHATVTVTGINDAPVNTVGAAMNFTEDTAGTIGSAGPPVVAPVNAITGISIADADADATSDVFTVTLSVQHGTLTIRTDVTGGIVAADIVGGANGSSTITITGTQTEINNTLAAVNGTAQPNGLVYTPAANYNGADALTVTTNDGGNSGTGGALADTDVKVINIADVNDAPTATDTSQAATTILEDTPLANGQSVSDLFGASFSDATDVQVNGGNPTGTPGDTLAGIAIVANGSNANGNWQYWDGDSWESIGAASADAAKTFTAATLIRFSPALNYNGAAPTLTAHLIESGGPAIVNGATVDLNPAPPTTGVYTAGTVVLSQDITAVNDAPVNDGMTGSFSGGSFVEDTTNVALTGLSVSDVDADPATQLLTVRFGVGFGTLSIATDVVGGVTGAQVQVVPGSGNAQLIITATQNQINATLAANGLTYTPNEHFNGSDTLAMAANDGGFSGNDPGGPDALSEQDDDAKAIVIGAANDAPTVNGDGAEDATTIVEDQPTDGQLVSALFGGQFADAADAQFIETTNETGSAASTLAGIAIIANGSGASGQWQYFNGTSWVDIGTASQSAAKTIAADTAIRFNPAPNFNGSAPTLTAHLVETPGALTNGATIDLSGIGATDGPTPYSGGTVVLGQQVDAINDAPVNTVGGAASASEDGPAVALTGISIADADADPAADVVTVTLSVGNGTLTILDNVTSGLVAGDIGGQGTDTVTLTGTLDEINVTLAAADALMYTPDADFSGSDGLTVLTDDGGATGGAAEQDSDVKTIDVAATNDAPTLAEDVALIGTDEDRTSAGGSVADILSDAGYADVDGPSAGMAVTGLSGNGSWQYSTDGGTSWHEVGAVSENAALLLSGTSELRYVPDGENGETATVSFRGWDGTSGVPTSDGTRSTADTAANGGETAFSSNEFSGEVAVDAINDAPVVTLTPPAPGFGRIGGETLVNTATEGDQIQHSVTPLEGGGWVAAWRDFSQSIADGGVLVEDPWGFGDYIVYTSDVKAQVFAANGAKVGDEFVVNSTTAEDQAEPKVVGLVGGGFAVVWYDFSNDGDTSAPGLKAQMFTAVGVPVGAEIDVNGATAGAQAKPQITALSNGGFAVTWQDHSGGVGGATGDAGGTAVKAQVIDAAGNPVGGEILVNSTTSGSQTNPVIETLDEGNGFVIVWWDDSSGGSTQDVRAQVFTEGGAPVGGEILVHNAAAGLQSEFKIAALEGGRFAVTWTDGLSSTAEVRAQVFEANGAKVGTEISVNVATAGAQDVPQITALANGGFVVTWNDESQGVGGATGDASARAVKARIYDNDGSPVTGEILVNTATQSEQLGAQVAALPDGGFLVTWHDFSQGAGGAGGDSDSYAVKGQLFAADGSKVGGELLVNSTTASLQSEAQVITLANGSNVVVWSDGSGEGADSSGLSIKSQMFGSSAGGFNATEQVPMNLKGSIAVGDVDAGAAAEIIVTLSVSFGVLDVTAGTSGATVSGTGTGTVTVTGTLAQIEALLATDPSSTVVFTANSDAPPATTTLTVTANDGGATGADPNLSGGPADEEGSAQVDIVIAPVSDAPTGAGTTVITSEDDSYTFGWDDFGFDDTPEADDPVGIVLTTLPDKGALELDGQALSTADLPISIAKADIDAGKLTFVPGADEYADDYASFQFRVEDNGATSGGGQNLSGTYTVEIEVTPDNINPTLSLDDTGPSATLDYVENDAASAIAPDALLADVDSLDFDTGTLTVGFDANGEATDQLGIEIQGTGPGQIGLSGSDVTYGGTVIGTVSGGGNGTDLVVTFDTDATPEAAQALVRAITYHSTSDAPSTLPRMVNFTVTDGDGGSAQANAAVNISLDNDAPQIDAPASIGGNEDEAVVFTGATAITIDDVDIGGGYATVVLSVADGALTLGSTAGLISVSDDGTGSVAISGSVAAINHALDGLSYLGSADSNGERTLSISVSDNGFTGANLIVNPGAEIGASAGDFSSSEVPFGWTLVNGSGGMTAVQYAIGAADDLNAADSADVVGGQDYFAGGPGSAPSSISQTINVAPHAAKIDAGSMLANVGGYFGGFAGQDDAMTMTVRFLDENGDVLGSRTIGGATAADRGDESKLLLDSAVAEIPALTRSIEVVLTSVHSDGVYTDGYADNLSLTLAEAVGETITIDLAAVNDPVALTLPAAPGLTGDEEGEVAITGVSISDVDAVLAPDGEYTVTLGAADGTLTLGTVTGLDFTAGDGTEDAAVTFKGTLAEVNAALATLSFTGGTDFTGATEIDISVTDATDTGASTGSGGASSDGGKIEVTVANVNDAPVLDLNGAAAGTGAILAYIEGEAAAAIAPDATVSDVDSADFDGGSLTVAVTGNGGSQDRLGLSEGSGVTVIAGVVGYLGTDIGTVSGGAGAGSPLQISFIGPVSQAAVEAVLQHVSYSNASNDPSTLARTITYTLTDGDGGSQTGTATATIDVTATDDAGKPKNDSAVTDEASTVTGNVLANDFDIDGTPVVATVNGSAADGSAVTLASGATVKMNADGSFEYDPNGVFDHLAQSGLGAVNDKAVDSFIYTLVDGTSATVRVTVNGLFSNPHLIAGGAGDDVLNGTGGTDIFRLERGGNDVAAGNGGNDRFLFNGTFGTDDAVDGGAGQDAVWLDGDYSAGVDLNSMTMRNIEMILLSGGNSYKLASHADTVAAGAALLVNGAMLSPLEELIFDGSAETDGSFHFVGGAGSDWLIGGAGNDVLVGNGGTNRLEGGGGNDVYFVSSLGDELVETAGGGIDLVRASVDHVLNDEVELLYLSGSARSGTGNGLANLIKGTDFADTLIGGGGHDQLVGRGGIDALSGGDGDDLLEGWANSDVLNGDAGRDRLFGGGGGDTMNGGLDDDRLMGGAGNDILNGGEANDVLLGQANKDVLTGGLGADVFVFFDGDSAASAAGADLITDFSQAEGDKVHLRHIDAIEGTAANDSFTFIGTGAFSGKGTGGELRYNQFGGNTFLQGDTDGDGIADFYVRVDGIVSLTANDLLI